MMNMENVNRTVGNQCQYGAESNSQPIKKPTGFMSNCPGIRKALSKTCSGKNGHCSRPGRGEHVLCNGRVARMAATLPIRLCKATLKGLCDQLRKYGTVIDGHAGMHERSMTKNGFISLCGAQEPEGFVEYDGHVLKFDNGESPFFDDLAKQELSAPLVNAARKKELEYCESKGVWKKVSIQEAWHVSGRPPITVRWVDVNKWDDQHPDMRSRLVARQIR